MRNIVCNHLRFLEFRNKKLSVTLEFWNLIELAIAKDVSAVCSIQVISLLTCLNC